MRSSPIPVAMRATFLLAAIITACSYGALRAQDPDSAGLDRMLNPNKNLRYDPADRKFDAAASVGTKQAAVRPFAFSRPAGLRAGDGSFHTSTFQTASGKGYRTGEFATKTARDAGADAFQGRGKTYAVRAVAVRDDRAAGKQASTKTYANSGKQFLVRGKRQDTLDDWESTKPMTIEQVRELLNKNK